MVQSRFLYWLPLPLVFPSYFEYVSKMFPQLMTGLLLLRYFLQFRDYKWKVIFDNFHLLVCMLVVERRRDAGSGFNRRSVCIYVDPIFWMSSLLYVASRRPLWRCLSRARPVVQAQWHTVTHLLTKGWQPVRGVAKFARKWLNCEKCHICQCFWVRCVQTLGFSSHYSETESLGTANECLLLLN